jgi:hypothetical protein
MKVVNFNFTKISIERLKDKIDNNLKFNTKLDLSSIDSLKSDILKIKDELIKIDFVYTVLYEPDFAKLELAGSLILSVDPKMAKEILKNWKDKQTSEEFRVVIFNVILKKSNIKAIQLEDEMGLPTHIPLPSFKPQNKKNEEKI